MPITAEQLAYIEAKLRDDSKAPTGYLITAPDGVGKAAADTAEGAIRDGQGKITVVESMAQGWGQGALAGGPSPEGQGLGPTEIWPRRSGAKRCPAG